MSGRRVKALRRKFADIHDRLPLGCRVVKSEALGGFGKKPWKDVVKVARSRIITAWTRNVTGGDRAVRTRSVGEMFMRKIFAVAVVEPSEWRRWKKAYQRENQ